MIDSNVWDVQDVGEGLRKIETDQQGPDQTGAHGHRDAVEVLSGDVGFVEGLIDEANRGGGGDNITVILLEVIKEGVWGKVKRKLKSRNAG